MEQREKEGKKEFILLSTIPQLPLIYLSRKRSTVVKKEKCYFHLLYLHVWKQQQQHTGSVDEYMLFEFTMVHESMTFLLK